MSDERPDWVRDWHANPRLPSSREATEDAEQAWDAVERFGSQPSEDNPRDDAVERVVKLSRELSWELAQWFGIREFDEDDALFIRVQGCAKEHYEALCQLDARAGLAAAPSPDPEGEQR